MDKNIKLCDLMDVSILQKMQDAFAKMARMAALTTDENGVPLTVGTNFSEFCNGYCRQSEIGRARCENCDKMGAVMTLENNKPVSYKCHANLVDFAAPIMLGDQMIGSFIGGQVLPEPPVEEDMRRIAREIEVDEDGFWEAAKKVQIIPQAAITRSTEFIYEFAQIMSDMAYNAYVSRELSKEAMQAAVQKSDFLANMSHEIRTPMNAVLGMAEMALREEMSDEAKTYIQQIQSSGKHLLVIINDILDFSKIDSGKMEIVETVFSTGMLLEDIINLVNSRIGTKDLEFIVDVPADMPKEFYGDAVRIQQILINLLNNAVKFTTKGKIILKCRYENIDDENVLVKFEVTDTGNGMKKEDIGKLFGSFQQIDSKRNRNIEGTGLGLAISKQLLELMHGSIRVESEYGVGSTFFVEFPIKVQTKSTPIKKLPEGCKLYSFVENKYVKDMLKEDFKKVDLEIIDLTEGSIPEFNKGDIVFAERVSYQQELNSLELSQCKVIVIDRYDAPNDIKGENVAVVHKPAYVRKLLVAAGMCDNFEIFEDEEDVFSFIAPEANVLIVDDNPINLTVAKGLLEPLEMNVDTACCAADCVEHARNVKYDVIFMDHMMPEVDGIETTHILRRMIDGYETVPIIALTANAVGGAKEMFIKEGMNDFVAKPIETDKLVAKLKQWLPKEKIVPAKIKKEEEKIDDVAVRMLSENTGLDVNEGIRMLGSYSMYMKFMKEYYSDIEKKTKSLNESVENKDYKNYTIVIHSIKSASKQLGAMELSEFAARLEKAGNENNTEVIDNENELFITNYNELREKLRNTVPELSEEKAKIKADKKVIIECLDELLGALDEFDILAIDDAYEKINELDLESEEEKQFLEELNSVHDEYDMDSAGEIIEKWKAYK